MAWYSLGTVALSDGSDIATGSGVAWSASAIAAADSLVLADGRVFEVSAVISGTSLRLARNYSGAAVSGMGYAIQPTGVASRLLDLIARQAVIQDDFEGYATHGPRVDNPHAVTAAQVGAVAEGDSPSFVGLSSGELSVASAEPRLLFSETDTATAARMLLTAGSLYLQSGGMGDAGSGADGGEVQVTGYFGNTLDLFKANAFSSQFSGEVVAFGGIKLGGTAESNRLDDYEKGTWLPALLDNVSGQPVYADRGGAYVKIGDSVSIHGFIKISSLGTLSGGGLRILGLPFACQDFSSVDFSYATGLNLVAGQSLSGYCNRSTNTIFLRLWNSVYGNSGIAADSITANTYVIFSAHYLTL